MGVSNTTLTDEYSALLSTTLRNYRKQLVDNIFRELPLLYWLNEKGRKRTLDGGFQIVVPLLYGENTSVKLYQGYDLLDVTPQAGITSAIYNWKQMAVSVSISREEERKNSGPHKLINLLEAKIQQAEKSMQWYLNDLLHGMHSSLGQTFTGGDVNSVDSMGSAQIETDYKGFNSLDHIVRSGWGLFDNKSATERQHVVGGIVCKTVNGTSQTNWSDWLGITAASYTNPWWMNYSNPGFDRLQRGEVGGTLGPPLTKTELDGAGYIIGAQSNYLPLVNSMRSMYNRLTEGTDHPDLILTGQSGFEAYETALLPMERYLDTKLGDAGFQNLKFKACTMIFDPGIISQIGTSTIGTTQPAIPPQPMYFLNSKYLEWTVDSETDFFTTPFYRPTEQDARTSQILLMANLCCSNRRKQGVMSLWNQSNGWSA